VVILHAAVAVVATGEMLRLTLTQVNRAPLPVNAAIELSLLDPAGNTTSLGRRRAALMEGIHELGDVLAGPAGLPGRYEIQARVLARDEIIAKTQQSILALAPVREWPEQIAGHTWLGERPPWLAQMAASSNVLAPGGSDEGLLIVARPGSLSEAEWDALLDRVRAGKTAILGALHKRDEVALRSLANHGLPLQLHLGIGNWMGCYHWAPASDLFDGLPAGGLAGPVYVDVLPWYVLTELGGEVLAGSFRNSMTRVVAPRALWYSDVEAVRHGAGEVIFCQYRVFDQAGGQPLAARLASNLMRLSAGRQRRRATAPKEATRHD
jgi:hypothetical protein